jgi:predicted nucleotidyltransferase component of viral defense system
MASSVHSKLTALQRDVLDAFFQRERGFFLTGGAALAGFHLGHRTTDDLDLFTPQGSAFERGRFVLTDVAAALGGELQVRQDAPGFKRLVLTRGDEGLVVDLVKDVSPQLHSEKLDRGNILIDPADEILANKLAALVGRAEERDLVDIMFLERAGYSIDAALPVALAKDGGCTPATPRPED